jgi:CRP-like cAMP-binding protein
MIQNESGQYSWVRRIAMQFLSEKEFDKIEKSAVNLHFKKGETIIKQGGLPSHIAILEKGIVKFNFENENNKNLILTIVSAPKILGGANLFYKDNNLFSFVAVEECDIVMIESSVLVNIMLENAKFSMMLFQLASEMFKKSVLNFISLAYKQKEGRIADILLYLMSEVHHSLSFTTNLTRKELSEFAGCSKENVIMTLSKWQNENIIRLDGKSIEIIDIEKLKHISKIG